MSDEIKLSASIEVKKTTSATVLDASESVTNLLVDMAGDAIHRTVQSVATSEEALSLGDAGTGGYLFLRNLDATNYVSLRQGTGQANFVRLEAGEVAMFRMDTAATAPFAVANTAAVNLLVMVVEA